MVHAKHMPAQASDGRRTARVTAAVTDSGRCAKQEPDVQSRSARDVRLLDDLIRAQQHCLRYREANLPRCFQVYGQPQSAEPLDRQVLRGGTS